jgi:hypothetical protein
MCHYKVAVEPKEILNQDFEGNNEVLKYFMRVAFKFNRILMILIQCHLDFSCWLLLENLQILDIHREFLSLHNWNEINLSLFNVGEENFNRKKLNFSGDNQIKNRNQSTSEEI